MAMVENALYPQERRVALEALDLHSIDAPILDIIRMFAALPYCFTLQSCCGHFILLRTRILIRWTLCLSAMPDLCGTESHTFACALRTAAPDED